MIGETALTAASSQPLPPTTLLEVWPSTTADRRMLANCLAPRKRSSARSTPLLSLRQPAHGALAVTRAACSDTPAGAIAHHSASGTASLPTMNRPMRARQPQLSRCVMRTRVPAGNGVGQAERLGSKATERKPTIVSVALSCVRVVVFALLIIAPLAGASAQKQSSILRITHRDSPASVAIHAIGTP